MKPIKGYEGRYSIDEKGKIFSHISNKFMNPKPEKANGYLRVRLSDEIKGVKKNRVSVAFLVAQTFIPNPKNLTIVDHINRIKTDNRVENLRWCTQSDNLRNRTKKKGTTSKYVGVSWDERNKNWMAHSSSNGKAVRLGRHKTEREAALAYNAFVEKDGNEFAMKNDVK